MHADVDKLIGRLHHVKEIKPGRWIAKCPAHDDQSPSLNITLAESGNILIKCWAGCGACDVIESVGMEMHELFPPDDHRGQRRRFKKDLDYNHLLLDIAAECRSKGFKQTRADKNAELEAYLKTRARS